MTLKFNNSYIKDSYTFLGRNEYGVKIKTDEKQEDYYMREKSVEQGEVKYQIKTIKGLLKKSKLDKVDLLIGGDLQSQLFASSFSAREFDIPFLGVYSACATFTEELLIASTLLENGQIKNVITTTSAHNLASEKQFRFPIEYGAIRKKVNTFTSTGSVSVLLTNEKSNIKVESATTGSVVDLGYTDANNFGACMAPGAAKTISEHLKETKRNIDYYDLVLTGDLGVYGKKILSEYLRVEYHIDLKNYDDSACMIYDLDNQPVFAGGSGPACLPLVAYSYIFEKMKRKEIRRVLLVATGALLSPTMTNQKLSIPSVSHAISLEVNDDLS